MTQDTTEQNDISAPVNTKQDKINLVEINSVIAVHKSTEYRTMGRSQRPRGLRRRSAAARLLGLWARIHPGPWMSVCCVVCCQGEEYASG